MYEIFEITSSCEKVNLSDVLNEHIKLTYKNTMIFMIDDDTLTFWVKTHDHPQKIDDFGLLSNINVGFHEDFKILCHRNNQAQRINDLIDKKDESIGNRTKISLLDLSGHKRVIYVLGLLESKVVNYDSMNRRWEELFENPKKRVKI